MGPFHLWIFIRVPHLRHFPRFWGKFIVVNDHESCMASPKGIKMVSIDACVGSIARLLIIDTQRRGCFSCKSFDGTTKRTLSCRSTECNPGWASKNAPRITIGLLLFLIREISSPFRSPGAASLRMVKNGGIWMRISGALRSVPNSGRPIRSCRNIE